LRDDFNQLTTLAFNLGREVVGLCLAGRVGGEPATFNGDSRGFFGAQCASARECPGKSPIKRLLGLCFLQFFRTHVS